MASRNCCCAGRIRAGQGVVADPADRLGEAGDRVVVVAHRTVAGPTLRDQVQPGQALLRRLDEVEPLVVHTQGESANLTDGLAAVGDELGVRAREPGGTERAAGLFVRGEDEPDRATRRPSLAHPLAHHRQHDRVEVLHVRPRLDPRRSRRRSRPRRGPPASRTRPRARRRCGRGSAAAAARCHSQPGAQSATRVVRRGSDSSRGLVTPTSSSLAATYSAASRSPLAPDGPKLEVSKRIRSLHRPATSSAALRGTSLRHPPTHADRLAVPVSPTGTPIGYSALAVRGTGHTPSGWRNR